MDRQDELMKQILENYSRIFKIRQFNEREFVNKYQLI